MDTLSFLKRILPEQGFKVLAEFDPGRKGPRQAFFQTHEQLARAALHLDAQGKTVYHACATFKAKGNRTQDNAGWARSFWLDLDVDANDPLKYPNLKAAITDLGRVCKELHLPLPMMVQSGEGLHAYWTLHTDITAAEWVLVADRLKRTLDTLGLRQDRTRTADSASILRPPGTHWRKNGQRPVKVLHSGSDIGFQDFASRLGVTGTPAVHAAYFTGVTNEDLGAPPDYPPSSADRITQFCPTLAYIAGERGNVTEPLWRAMLGVVKYTTEGVQRCHEWSAGHPDYDEAETQEKIDRWIASPTTCEHFRGTNGNCCADCERTCTSPIQLGYLEEAPAPTAPLPDTPSDDPPAVIPHWPKQFYWNQHTLCHAMPSEDGEVQWMPFCETLFYPVQRIRLEDSTWALLCRYHKRNGTVGEFNLPTELLGRPNELAAALAAQEIVTIGAKGKMHVNEYLRTYMLGLQAQNIQQLTYQKCGWADEYQSFIVGNKRLRVDTEDTVLTGEQMQAGQWACNLGVAGDAAQWTELIDYIYNREGAEPFQFALGAAFAAPLVEISEVDNWHGIPVALTGTTGLGKSTTAIVACSIYGRGKNFLAGAQRDQSTLNALITRIGTLRNLPMVFDELSNREVKEVTSLLYALSNGRPKDRVTQQGTLINQGLEWKTITFVTSNKNITEFLWTQEEGNVTEATQLRCFEIPLSADMLKIWSGISALDLIEHKLMTDHYGVVGRQWLRYVMQNRGALREEFRKLRAKYNANDAEETKERYFRDLIVSVVLALRHTSKLGLTKFDAVRIAEWAKDHIKTLRRQRQAGNYTPEEHIGHFLGSLHGRIIITHNFKDGRGIVESPIEKVFGEPAGRMAIKDKRFLVTTKAVNDWCQDNRISPSKLILDMWNAGYLVNAPSSSNRLGSKKERFTKGTNFPSAQLYCYEINYDKVLGFEPQLGETT